MNKQDEEKAVSIAESCIGKRTRNHPANQLEKIIIRDACLKMTTWKEQQMIEKACNWFEKNWTMYTYPSHLMFEDFKKYMEEN